MAPVTFWLMAANVAVTLLTTLFVAEPDAFFWNWGLVPSQLGASLHGWVTVFTSMFLHGGWLHLAANMIMLYFAGRLVETRIGPGRTATLYAVAGVLAGLAQVAWDPTSGVPMVGASGAISGMFAAAVMLAPRERVLLITPLTLFIPIPMRLLTLGWLWLALQVIGLMGADPFGGGVAYMAHLGGYAGGLLFVWGLGWALARRRESSRADYARRLAIQHGPAPSPRYRTVYVTDSMGRTFAFHEPR
ncbi:MAG: rhomboid family intramembrane serine protease [Myxococcales bacterium]|nr:rhomboid family intramembrane serine protease [Myxococcales bacterium]